MTSQVVINLIVDHLYFVLLIVASLISIRQPATRLLAALLTVQSVADTGITWLLLEYGGTHRAMLWFPSFMITEACLIVGVIIKVRSLRMVIRADLIMVSLSIIAILIQFFGFMCKVILDIEADWVRTTYSLGSQSIYWLQLALIYVSVIVARAMSIKKTRETVRC